MTLASGQEKLWIKVQIPPIVDKRRRDFSNSKALIVAVIGLKCTKFNGFAARHAASFHKSVGTVS